MSDRVRQGAGIVLMMGGILLCLIPAFRPVTGEEMLENGECGSTFSGCTALKRVVLPKSLTNIYASSFYGCTALEEIAYCGSEAEWSTVMIGQGNDQLGLVKVTYNYETK